jgi:hypothetical protein
MDTQFTLLLFSRIQKEMDLALDITSSCRVRVLLVPVSPIKKSTFWHHVELVRKFSLVRLGDVTPDLHKGANGEFLKKISLENILRYITQPSSVAKYFKKVKCIFSL